MPFYSTNYTSLGAVQLPFNIVGTDPAKGAATTSIPTVIVPINIVFEAGTVNTSKPSGPVELDGSGVVPAVQNSPIFQVADYKVGGADLGVTQYGDALQRGEIRREHDFLPRAGATGGRRELITLYVEVDEIENRRTVGRCRALRAGVVLGDQPWPCWTNRFGNAYRFPGRV